MALFVTSYSRTTSLLTGPEPFPPPGQAGEAANDGSQQFVKHENFIRLLQYAQASETPILPLTWEPAFENLGLDGAMGTVGQNILNASVSLAFKRFRPYPASHGLSEAQFRDQQYEAFIKELLVYSQAAVQEHANVAELVGLCFELASTEEASGGQNAEEIRPVLVMIKSSQGSLDTFVEQCASLDEETMLRVCGEVTKALSVLHRSSMIDPAYVLPPSKPARSLTNAEGHDQTLSTAM